MSPCPIFVLMVILTTVSCFQEPVVDPIGKTKEELCSDLNQWPKEKLLKELKTINCNLEFLPIKMKECFTDAFKVSNFPRNVLELQTALCRDNYDDMWISYSLCQGELHADPGFTDAMLKIDQCEKGE